MPESVCSPYHLYLSSSSSMDLVIALKNGDSMIVLDRKEKGEEELDEGESYRSELQGNGLVIVNHVLGAGVFRGASSISQSPEPLTSAQNRYLLLCQISLVFFSNIII